jgi:uncharacterized protein YndB with AHSA1/START domain
LARAHQDEARSPVAVRVTRRFSAAPERVFDAWLDPEMIGRWMFGPALRDEDVVRSALDKRVGGSFSFVVRREGEEIDHMARISRSTAQSASCSPGG